MARNSVFDRYAHEYDWLTNAPVREEQHSREVTALITTYSPEHVLDAGCATGLTSMLFAKQGVTAVGLDQSKRMVSIAREKYRDSGLPLTFETGSFERLPARMRGTFDLVVCLANSLSGVATVSDLKRCIGSFHDVLRPNGTLVVQLLNGSALKIGEGIPLKVTEHQGIMYLRHLERSSKGLTLEVIRVDRSVVPATFDLFRSTFPTFTRAMLTNALESKKFHKVRCYRDLFLTERFRKTARDLVIVGTK